MLSALADFAHEGGYGAGQAAWLIEFMIDMTLSLCSDTIVLSNRNEAARRAASPERG